MIEGEPAATAPAPAGQASGPRGSGGPVAGGRVAGSEVSVSGMSVPGVSATRSRRTVIGVLGVGQVLVWGSSYYLPAVLAKPVADATGWPLSWVIGGLSLGLLVSGLVSPKVGDLIERYGGRPVLMASAALLAAGLLGLAVAPNLAVFTLGWLVIGAAMGAGLYDPAFATIGRLYGKQARAVITTLTLIGGFSSTICWPLSALLLHHLGWRGACLTYAAINLCVVLPLYRFGLPAEARVAAVPTQPVDATAAAQAADAVDAAHAADAIDPAQAVGAIDAAAGQAASPPRVSTSPPPGARSAPLSPAASLPFSRWAKPSASLSPPLLARQSLSPPSLARQSLSATSPSPTSPPLPAPAAGGWRHLLFALVAVSMTLASVIAAVMSVQLLGILQQRGVPLAGAVALGAIIGPCQVGARLIDLLAGQRTHPVWEGVLSAILVTLGLGLLLTRQDAMVPALVVYGGGIGLRSIVRGTLPLALFGPVGYPSLIGRLAFPMLLGQAIAPSAGAVLLVQFGGHAVLLALLWTAIVTLAVSAMLVPFAHPRAARLVRAVEGGPR